MPKDAGSEFSVFLARFCECSCCALQFPFCFLKFFEDLFLYLASPDGNTSDKLDYPPHTQCDEEAHQFAFLSLESKFEHDSSNDNGSIEEMQGRKGCI